MRLADLLVDSVIEHAPGLDLIRDRHGPLRRQPEDRPGLCLFCLARRQG